MSEVQSRSRLWRSQAGLAALVIVAVTALWRGFLLRDSFFNQDDYYLTSRALHAKVTWSFLFEPVAGHVQPAQQLTYWAVANYAPFDWPVVATGILLAQLVCVVVMWHLLGRLLPGRWLRVPLLAVFALSPLTLATTLWWSAAMGLWPGVLAALVATLCLVRALQGLGRRWVNLTLCWSAVVVGLLWHEQAILITALLLGVAISMSEARGVRRVPDALVRGRALWIPLALLGAAYVVLHGLLTTVGDQSATPPVYAGIVWNALVRNALPGLVSGPWAGTLDGGAVVPALWATSLSGVVALLVVALLLRFFGANARWALLMLLLYVVAALAMLLLGRAGYGRIIGLDPRYTSELVAAVTIFLALAARPTAQAPPPEQTRRARPAAWLALTALYVVGCVAGTAVLVPHFQNRDDRTYVNNLRSDFASDPSQVLVDDAVPATILLPLLGEESKLSHVFAPLPEHLVYDQPTEHLRRVDSDGHLRAVTLAFPVAMKPGATQCGYPVRGRPVWVPLQGQVTGPVAVRIGYFTDREADVRVRTSSGSTQVFRAQRGPNLVWLVVPDQGEPIRGWWFQVDGTSSSAVCIANLFAGGVQK